MIRVGRAVLIDTALIDTALIDTAGNEGGGGPDPEGELQDQLDAMSSATAVPVSRMCDYSKAGCPDASLFPAPRRLRRP